MLTSLNPFEFRAGLKPKKQKVPKRQLRLNPFEFRAGLKREKRAENKPLFVLIPLNSGLA